MKERPILFNAEMVRAILSGRKTQTRRVVQNVRPDNCLTLIKATKTKSGIHTHVLDAPSFGICPLGQPGDQLWVRETFATLGNEDGCAIDWQENLIKAGGPEAARIYRASCEQRPGNYGLWSIPDVADWKPHTWNVQYEGSWVPSIHMPRWASRINLLITGVRVERLNSISEEDAKAEGVDRLDNNFGNGPAYCDYLLADSHDQAEWYSRANDSFLSLWESIYGPDSVRENPWVWVIEFELINNSGVKK